MVQSLSTLIMEREQRVSDLFWKAVLVIAFSFWLLLAMGCQQLTLKPGETFHWGNTEGSWPLLLNITEHYQAL